MNRIAFIPFDPRTPPEGVAALLDEYLAWANAALVQQLGQAALQALQAQGHAEGHTPLQALASARPPHGAAYGVTLGGQLAGVCALRPLREHTAEIKRVYVRPAFRGQGLGPAIVAHLLREAHALGHRTACLDSAPFMTAAQRLYEACGFVDCAPYEGTDVPAALHGSWRFMQRHLVSEPTA